MVGLWLTTPKRWKYLVKTLESIPRRCFVAWRWKPRVAFSFIAHLQSNIGCPIIYVVDITIRFNSASSLASQTVVN